MNESFKIHLFHFTIISYFYKMKFEKEHFGLNNSCRFGNLKFQNILKHELRLTQRGKWMLQRGFTQFLFKYFMFRHFCLFIITNIRNWKHETISSVMISWLVHVFAGPLEMLIFINNWMIRKCIISLLSEPIFCFTFKFTLFKIRIRSVKSNCNEHYLIKVCKWLLRNIYTRFITTPEVSIYVGYSGRANWSGF